MAQLSRLHTAEMQDGEDVLASIFNDEFDQLVAESNSQDTRITAVEDIDTTANTWTQTQTFSAASDPIKTNIISEQTSATGVTIDSVLHKDGFIRVPAGAGFTPTTNGDFGYDSTSNTYDVYVNGAAKAMLHTGSNIDDLNDVTITSAVSGQALKYNGSAFVNANLLGTAPYTSSELSISTAASATLTHGLGTVPKLVLASLICKSSEYGYTTGMSVPIMTNFVSTGSSQYFGLGLALTTTSIVYQMGNNAPPFYVYQITGTPGSPAAITSASWRLVIEAYI